MAAHAQGTMRAQAIARANAAAHAKAAQQRVATAVSSQTHATGTTARAPVAAANTAAQASAVASANAAAHASAMHGARKRTGPSGTELESGAVHRRARPQDSGGKSRGHHGQAHGQPQPQPLVRSEPPTDAAPAAAAVFRRLSRDARPDVDRPRHPSGSVEPLPPEDRRADADITARPDAAGRRSRRSRTQVDALDGTGEPSSRAGLSDGLLSSVGGSGIDQLPPPLSLPPIPAHTALPGALRASVPLSHTRQRGILPLNGKMRMEHHTAEATQRSPSWIYGEPASPGGRWLAGGGDGGRQSNFSVAMASTSASGADSREGGATLAAVREFYPSRDASPLRMRARMDTAARRRAAGVRLPAATVEGASLSKLPDPFKVPIGQSWKARLPPSPSARDSLIYRAFGAASTSQSTTRGLPPPFSRATSDSQIERLSPVNILSFPKQKLTAAVALVRGAPHFAGAAESGTTWLAPVDAPPQNAFAVLHGVASGHMASTQPTAAATSSPAHAAQVLSDPIALEPVLTTATPVEPGFPAATAPSAAAALAGDRPILVSTPLTAKDTATSVSRPAGAAIAQPNVPSPPAIASAQNCGAVARAAAAAAVADAGTAGGGTCGSSTAGRALGNSDEATSPPAADAPARVVTHGGGPTALGSLRGESSGPHGAASAVAPSVEPAAVGTSSANAFEAQADVTPAPAALPAEHAAEGAAGAAVEAVSTVLAAAEAVATTAAASGVDAAVPSMASAGGCARADSGALLHAADPRPLLNRLVEEHLPKSPAGTLQQRADETLMLLRCDWGAAEPVITAAQTVEHSLVFCSNLAKLAQTQGCLQGALFQALTNLHAADERQRVKKEWEEEEKAAAAGAAGAAEANGGGEAGNEACPTDAIADEVVQPGGGECRSHIMQRSADGVRPRANDGPLRGLPMPVVLLFASGAVELRKSLRIKIEDDKDLETARRAFAECGHFVLRLREEAAARGVSETELLRKLEVGEG